MVCYFKSIETFITIGQAQVTDFSVPIASANGNTGKITVVGELTQTYTRQWLILNGRLYYVTEVEPRNGMTEITVGDALTAFGRTLVYTEPSTNILGEWIKELAETEYAELADTAYDMPYLTATNSDTTEFAHVAPKDNLFTLESVMRNAQSRGIDISFSFTRTALALTISPGDTTERVLVDGDGHTQLVSETYSKTAIAKVTVISTLGYPHDYYLDVAGNISTTVPLNRAEGEWITVKQGEENLLDTATAAFAQNVASHKIELYSDAELPLYSSVVVRLKDKAYKTTVTYVGAFSNDNRFLYRCGELATTLTEKIESISHAEIDSNVTRLSELINDTGFVTAAEAAAAAPVQSVNGKTGAFNLTAADVGAKPDSYTAPVDSVNGQTGAVTVAGTDYIVTEEYEVVTSFSAGTIGTRGAQVHTDCTKSGYTLIGAWVTYIANSTNYNPVVFKQNNAQGVYCNFYRATASAVSTANCRFTCVYKKN